MISRARAGAVPVEFTVSLGDGHVVDARVAVFHVAVGVELPVLVALPAVPLARAGVLPVGEPDVDAHPIAGPQFLDQPVLVLAGPLAGQELDDLFPPVDELRAVSPLAVLGVGEGDLVRVAGVPRVLGGPDLPRGGLRRGRR